MAQDSELRWRPSPAPSPSPKPQPAPSPSPKPTPPLCVATNFTTLTDLSGAATLYGNATVVALVRSIAKVRTLH